MTSTEFGVKDEHEIPDKPPLFEVPCPGCSKNSYNVILKPGITHRLICPECRTVFYIHLKKDLGIVVLEREEYSKSLCKNCKGVGKCSDCKGTGKIICPQCNGNGWYIDNDGDYGCCRLCGGLSYWYTSGELLEAMIKEERASLGKGYLICKSCAGTGNCNNCYGEGLIFET
jgi:uncharacterized protein YbaR (Trm112 family)